jgi:2-polyprenyl-3-methyl-5-hydroxy-6-metoxy-1,4-benzoquinol methylase
VGLYMLQLACGPMSIGPRIRRLLDGQPRLVQALTDAYRGFFVDLDAVVASIPVDQPDATFLNIGTGDGGLLNTLRDLHPELRITTTDIHEHQGWLLRPDVRESIDVHVHTPERIVVEGFGKQFDIVFMSDVLHHVPPADRADTVRAAFAACRPGGRLVIKDIEEKGLKARLSLLSDVYLTGDKHTKLIGEAALRQLIERTHPDAQVASSDLITRDFPNYLVVATSAP